MEQKKGHSRKSSKVKGSVDALAKESRRGALRLAASRAASMAEVRNVRTGVMGTVDDGVEKPLSVPDVSVFGEDILICMVLWA